MGTAPLARPVSAPVRLPESGGDFDQGRARCAGLTRTSCNAFSGWNYLICGPTSVSSLTLPCGSRKKRGSCNQSCALVRRDRRGNPREESASRSAPQVGSGRRRQTSPRNNRSARLPPRDLLRRMRPLCELARCPNLCVKASGCYACGATAAVVVAERVLEWYSPNRVPWGSDFSPALGYGTLADTLAVLDRLGLSAAERRLVAGRNVERLPAPKN